MSALTTASEKDAKIISDGINPQQQLTDNTNPAHLMEVLQKDTSIINDNTNTENEEEKEGVDEGGGVPVERGIDTTKLVLPNIGQDPIDPPVAVGPLGQVLTGGRSLQEDKELETEKENNDGGLKDDDPVEKLGSDVTDNTKDTESTTDKREIDQQQLAHTISSSISSSNDDGNDAFSKGQEDHQLAISNGEHPSVLVPAMSRDTEESVMETVEEKRQLQEKDKEESVQENVRDGVITGAGATEEETKLFNERTELKDS